MAELRLVCIDDGVPPETPRLLGEAAAARGVAFTPWDPRGFDPLEIAPLGPGDLLYAAATSRVAWRAEQHLHGPGTASFHADPDGPLFAYQNQLLLFDRAGLPAPRSLPVLSVERDRLRRQVDALGGLPVIVKLGGWSRGIGTIRVDALPTLFSLLDLLQAQGHTPLLMAYVPDAVHWRVVVVGQRAVAAYTNPVDADDFRSSGSRDPAAVVAEPDPALAALAVAAVASCRLEMGGVDILAHRSGRLYLLESNFPCYFAHAQLVAGIDVAGAMLDHLVAKARRLLAG